MRKKNAILRTKAFRLSLFAKANKSQMPKKTCKIGDLLIAKNQFWSTELMSSVNVIVGLLNN
jgi:hypothetical protein